MTVFRFSQGFYLFGVLVRILPFFGTHTPSTLFRYYTGQFFHTLTASTFSGHSPRFYYFSVLTLIRPFFGTRRDSFSILHGFYLFRVLAQILLFFGTHTASTLFRYSTGQFFHTQTNFYLFRALAQILLFFGTHIDSTLFRYSP